MVRLMLLFLISCKTRNDADDADDADILRNEPGTVVFDLIPH